MRTPYVLVVDDDQAIRDSLAEILEDENHRVRVASNGRDALEMIRAGEPPCMVLLDLTMPVMDGWAFAREASRDPGLAAIPICVVTASGPTQPLPPGAVGVVRKPFRLDRLFTILNAHCRAWS